MNQADSEKINMVLLQSGFIKVPTWQQADVVVFNTCSVRQKWEDRVFGMLHEIKKENQKRLEVIARSESDKAICQDPTQHEIASLHSQWQIITWITGCMVRKTGIAKKHLDEDIKRHKTSKIELLDELSGIYNSDDKLFPRSETIDFTLRIEETKYVPHILTHIYGEKIGQEDKFDDYLKQVQQRENPASANVIIQTGCDNYCTFCIVPYTRGLENSRPHDEILQECKEAVESGAKEITLLGQNVNSYGKQFIDKKLWNEEKSSWNAWDKKLKIGIDIDDTLLEVWCPKVLEIYNKKFHDILKFDDVHTFNFDGNTNLRDEYQTFGRNNKDLQFQAWAKQSLIELHKQWHKLFLITSRDIKEKDFTVEFLQSEFWADFFQEIIFIMESGADTKYRAAMKNKLDIVIDDAPHHIEWYTENCPNLKVIIFDQTWNTHIPTDNTHIYRIHNWSELDGIIEKSLFVSPFRKLLQDINSIPGLDRIRFTSSNPHDMTRDILDAHIDLDHTCNYLHFALQSGNNQMLKKMNRKHSYEEFRDMVHYLRQRDPLFSISTDIIVGYSWETDEMFEETVKAFTECEFDFAYIARYSVRPQTLAAKMYPDDVPDSVKAERWNILNNLLLENIQKRNTLMLGRTEEILISTEKDNHFSGRTRNFKEVLIEKDENIKIGDSVSVKIEKMDRYILLGKKV